MLKYPLKNDLGAGLSLSVIITQRGNVPAIELRAVTTNAVFIEAIIRAAFLNQAIKVMPCFSNISQSLNSAIKKGILYQAPAALCNICNTKIELKNINSPCPACNNINFSDWSRDWYFFTENYNIL